jgi:transposase, IS30 family
MPCLRLTVPEREEIGRALIEDAACPWAVIGRRLDRDPTTIAREVRASGGRGGYCPAITQRRAERAVLRPRRHRLCEVGPLRDRVTAELVLGQSPEAIWTDLVADEVQGRVCVESIYTAVFAGVLVVKATDCLRSRRRRRRSRQTRRANTRPALVNISSRPAEVNDRSEAGHWEADHIIGRANQSAFMCLTERMSRFSLLITMPEGYGSHAALAGLVHGLEQVPAHLRQSITFDQGSEWAQWPTLEATYDLKAWFCDPHSPWQRGQVENLNRQWRWWFPRGTDLARLDQAYADEVAALINGQRRRSFGYESPAAIYAALTVSNHWNSPSKCDADRFVRCAVMVHVIPSRTQSL